ncbi:hypothetical protein C2W62_32310 [Candidatus Entotheonella serta]|nr:hypothetical protein C2W62_32310 [Candidatus Entotheonella serta]
MPMIISWFSPVRRCAPMVLALARFGFSRTMWVSMAAVSGVGCSCAALIAVPCALVFDAPWTLQPSALSLFGLFLLALFTAVLAPVVYVVLIRSAGPSFAALSNYLVPPLTILLGFVLLGQQPDWYAYIALGLILAGVAISQRR